MGIQDQPAEPQIVDSLVLMRAFLRIMNPADRRKVIELAAALARTETGKHKPSQ
jgi:hypothetical protein